MLKDFFGDPIPKRDDVVLEYENILNHTPEKSKFDLNLENKDIAFKKEKELTVEVVYKSNKNQYGKNRRRISK